MASHVHYDEYLEFARLHNIEGARGKTGIAFVNQDLARLHGPLMHLSYNLSLQFCSQFAKQEQARQRFLNECSIIWVALC